MNILPIGYSFLGIAIGFIIVVGIILLTNNPKVNDYIAFAVIVIAFIIAWGIVHPRPTVIRAGAQEVQNMIGAGKPVLLEFQSPYCIVCISIKPMLDELEKELEGQVHIIRVNIQDEIGRDLIQIYGFQFTPTFIYFDADGNELWRQVGEFDPQRVKDSLE